MNKIIKVSLLALLAITPAARATTTYDWAITNSNGNVYNGDTGTFTVEDTTTTNPSIDDTTSTPGPFTGYLVTGISGTFGDSTITGLVAPGGDQYLAAGYNNDNILGIDEPTLMDLGGIAFTTSNDATFVFDYFFAAQKYYEWGNGGGGNLGFDVTVATPEPSSLALFAVSGVSGLLFLRRRNQ